MTELGGTCAITTEPGKGCRTEFSIPLKEARRSPWDWFARWHQHSKPANAPANRILQMHDSAN